MPAQRPPRVRFFRLFAISTSFALTAALPARPARATEGDVRLGASLGYAEALSDSRWAPGGVVGVEAEYGMSDSWVLRGAVDTSLHPVHADVRPGGLVRTTSAEVDVSYALDVVRWVPRFELGTGLVDLAGAVRHAAIFMIVEGATGLDYVIDRRWAVGGVLRRQVLVEPIVESGPTNMAALVGSFSFRVMRSF